MKTTTVIFVICIFLISSSCNKEDWSKKSVVPFSSSSNFQEGATLGNRELQVLDSKIYISSINITGQRLQAEDVNYTLNELMEINLSDNINATIKDIKMPIGTYETLRVTMSLTSDCYLEGEVSQINGAPQTKFMQLPLDLEGYELEFDLVQESEQELITINLDSEKVMRLNFDLQKTLNGVGNGPWNGLIAASQSQSNVDVTTIAGQNFLIKFKEQLLENSSLKIE